MNYKGFLKNIKKGSLSGVTAGDIFVVEKPDLTKAQVFDEANTFTASPSTIPATQPDHVPQFGQIPTSEHQLTGNRQVSNISGVFPLYWDMYSQFRYTPDAAAELVDTNLPTGNKRQVMDGVFKASAFAVTFPAGWKARAGNDALSDTLDTFCTAVTISDTEVLYTLENIPA